MLQNKFVVFEFVLFRVDVGASRHGNNFVNLSWCHCKDAYL